MERNRLEARHLAALIVFAGAVILDQITKAAAVSALKENGNIPLIRGVLEFAYVENRGAAFGIFQNGTLFFSVTAVAALIIIAFLYGKTPGTKRYFLLRICFVLIAAGAAGNLIDRIRLHYVRDFIYFSLINFPVFNVADIYVTVCTFGLAALVLFYYREDELVFFSPHG